MTPIERAFLNRLRRRASRVSAEMARRELAAYDMVRRLLSEAELVRAIESGQLDRLLLEVLNDENLDPAFAKLRVRVDMMVAESVKGEAMQLPAWLKPRTFGVFNPLVIQAATILDTRVVNGLKNEIRETVMQEARWGLEAGESPKVTARRIRSTVGLAPNQSRAVENFRRMLTEGDGELFTRALRDRRFDGTIRKAFAGNGLTQAQIDKMVDAYRRRFIAFNAETHARTLALDANKQAQRLAWEDAIARGVVSADQLVRTWLAVGGPHGDGRNRAEHLALHGTEVGFREPFPNGEMEPGESTYNCRCVARVTLAAGSQRQAA